MYDIGQLEAFAVQLRDVSNRRTMSQASISKVCEIYLKNTDKSPTAVKVLANYVSDIEANSTFVYGIIKGKFPVSTTNKDFATVQLVLLNNILTTNKECIAKSECHELIEKLLALSNVNDVDNDIVVEVLTDVSSIMDSLDIELFLKLRDLMINYNNQESMDLVLECSIKVNSKNLKESDKETIFFKLYNEIKEPVGEQVLLNLSYEFGINNFEFFKRLIDTVFEKGELVTACKPMALLLVSNEIIAKIRMEYFLHSVNIPGLINDYFINVYPGLTFQKPWELQSIVLFNKIPLDQVVLSETARSSYIKHTREIINSTTIQLNFDVACLQLVFLSRVFNGEKETFELIDHFRKGNYSIEFNYILNKFFFSYLTRNKNDKELVVKTVKDANSLFNESIKSKKPIHITYMLEFSKILGIYAESYGKQSWFSECFCTFESMFQDLDSQVKQMKAGEQQAWEILENNIKFSKNFL